MLREHPNNKADFILPVAASIYLHVSLPQEDSSGGVDYVSIYVVDFNREDHKTLSSRSSDVRSSRMDFYLVLTNPVNAPRHGLGRARSS